MTDPTTNDAHPNEPGLAGLARMSMTAGALAPGADSYRSINPFAVAAVVAGALSMGAALNPVFLLIPIAGLILGLIATVQIRQSHGTQAGQIVALLGIVLCLAIGGLVIFQRVQEKRYQAEQVQAVQALISDFGQKLSEGKPAEAYELFSPGLRERVSPQPFVALFQNSSIGRLESAETNDRVQIIPAKSGTPDVAKGVVVFTFNNDGETTEHKEIVNFVRQPDGWKVSSFNTWFGGGS